MRVLPFCCSGAVTVLRIAGLQRIVNLNPTQREVNHVHTVWRDPQGDFGADVLARHRATFH